MLLGLIFNVSSDHISSHFVSYTSDKVAVAPQLTSPKLLSQSSKLFEYFSRRYTLQYLHHFCRRIFRWHFQEYVHMVFHYLHGVNPKPIFLCYPLKHFLRVLSHLTCQDRPSILRYPDQMVLDIKNGVLCSPIPHAIFIPEKALFRQTPLPRLLASHFPPASKLAGIQWNFL